MPILPKLETSQSVFSNVALAPQQVHADADAFGASVGQAEQQAGSDFQQIGLRQKAIDDETAVNDQFYKQTFPSLTDATQKYLSLQGKDAVDGLKDYQQQLEDIRSQQRDQLANPAQQRMFDQVVRKTIAFNYDGAARHATQQNQVYQDQTSQGMVDASGQLAVQHWNDPNGFNVGLQSGVNEIMTHGQFRGQPVEYTLNQARQFTSKTYTERLTQMANSDPVGALNLLENGEHYADQNGQSHDVDIKSQIDAATLPSLQAHLLSSAKQVIAANIAHNAIYGGSILNPTAVQPGTQDALPLAAVVSKMESNNQDTDANGNLVTSAKGAQGSMQVMPATSANPGFGVTPAKDNSPAELARVGRDYLGAMTARYQNPALILAAYNAGPGVVDDWLNGTNKTGKNPGNVQLPDPRSGAISDADFAAKIPFSETRSYVGKGLSMVQQPGDKPTSLPTTSELKTELPAIVENARAAASRMFPNDPQFADTVAARVANQGNTVLQGVTAQENAARDTLLRLQIGSKPDGSDRVTSMDQLLSTQVGRDAWAQATPEVQKAIQDNLSNPAKVPMTQAGFNLYYQLKGQAANDPNAFLKQDISQLFGKLPLAQVMELTNQQAALAKGDQNGTTRALSWNRTKSDVEDMLKPIGLGNTAKSGTDQAAQTEQFYGKLQDQLEAYHSQTGKYPDTVTTRKMAAALLVQGTQGPDRWYWFSGKIPAFQSPDITQFHVPIPDDQKPALAASFQKAYGRAPTDDELAQAYTRFKLSLGKK